MANWTRADQVARRLGEGKGPSWNEWQDHELREYREAASQDLDFLQEAVMEFLKALREKLTEKCGSSTWEGPCGACTTAAGDFILCAAGHSNDMARRVQWMRAKLLKKIDDVKASCEGSA